MIDGLKKKYQGEAKAEQGEFDKVLKALSAIVAGHEKNKELSLNAEKTASEKAAKLEEKKKAQFAKAHEANVARRETEKAQREKAKAKAEKEKQKKALAREKKRAEKEKIAAGRAERREARQAKKQAEAMAHHENVMQFHKAYDKAFKRKTANDSAWAAKEQAAFASAI